jgi:hypothetical protein
MRWTALLALGVLATALPALGASREGSEAMTIRLVSITTSAKVLRDLPPTNVANGGDVVWVKSELLNERPQFGKPKGARVGSDVTTLTYVTASVGDVKVTVKLPGGTLRVTGRFRSGDTGQTTVRVTGGTGVFRGARGSCTVSQQRGLRALNVYRLQLP